MNLLQAHLAEAPKAAPLTPPQGGPENRRVSVSPSGVKELRRQGQAQLFLSRETIWTWEFALPHSWNSLLLKFFKLKSFI